MVSNVGVPARLREDFRQFLACPVQVRLPVPTRIMLQLGFDEALLAAEMPAGASGLGAFDVQPPIPRPAIGFASEVFGLPLALENRTVVSTGSPWR